MRKDFPVSLELRHCNCSAIVKKNPFPFLLPHCTIIIANDLPQCRKTLVNQPQLLPHLQILLRPRLLQDAAGTLPLPGLQEDARRPLRLPPLLSAGGDSGSALNPVRRRGRRQVPGAALRRHESRRRRRRDGRRRQAAAPAAARAQDPGLGPVRVCARSVGVAPLPLGRGRERRDRSKQKEKSCHQCGRLLKCS